MYKSIKKIFTFVITAYIVLFFSIIPVLADNEFFADTNGTAYFYESNLEIDLSSGFTISYWNNQFDVADTGYMVRIGAASGSYRVQLYSSNVDAVRLGISTNGTTWTYWAKDTGGTGYNAWVHIAFTYDGTDTKLYIDGEYFDETDTITGSVYNSGTADFYLNNSGTGSYIGDNGWDDFRIYDSALSEDDINDVYNCQTIEPYHTDLKAYYNFNNEDGNDDVGVNHLTEYNSPSYIDTNLPYIDECVDKEEPTATTTLNVCQLPDNTVIQRIVGCMNIYTTSTTTPSEVREWQLDVPAFLFMYAYLMGIFTVGIVAIYIFYNKKNEKQEKKKIPFKKK